MNSDTPPPDEFEQQLSEFTPTPLPEEWRAELIANAGAAVPMHAKTVAFSLFQKISLSGIAAAWVAIAALRLTTPTTDAGKSADLTVSTEPESQPDLPLLVRYIEDRNAMTEQF